jgi:serine protease AprX
VVSRVNVLLEFDDGQADAFAGFTVASADEVGVTAQTWGVLDRVAGLGVELTEASVPVPMFTPPGTLEPPDAFFALATFNTAEPQPDLPSASTVVAVECDRSRLDDLRDSAGIRVWPDSRLTLLADHLSEEATGLVFDLATSASGIDCRPFRPAVSIAAIRQLLGVGRIWQEGFRGQNTVVGIIDEGVDGTIYPVVGGFSRPGAQQPGSAPISSHGSMCAADVLVAAPAAKLYDYPFLGVPRSGGALAMFQAVLDQRRIDGTPHLTNNSYGFTGVPTQAQAPDHEIWDLNHPLHRKVREVVQSGAATFFAAGNCGGQCPSGACHASGIGAGRSIHASNSLAEVITVAAVNSRHDRIGYSSQGPGMFEPAKPDIAAYSHFFGNLGPGRPAGGGSDSFDNGTSAASPVAAGVAALLLSAHPGLTPDRLRSALIRSASSVGPNGWDPDYGHGVVNAAAAHRMLELDVSP